MQVLAGQAQRRPANQEHTLRSTRNDRCLVSARGGGPRGEVSGGPGGHVGGWVAGLVG